MVQDNEPGNPLERLIANIKSGRVPLPLIGGLAALVVIGIIAVGVALSSGGGDGDNNDTAATGSTGGLNTPRVTPTSGSGGLQTAQPTPEATADLNQPTAEAQNLTSIEEGDKLIIPSIGVDAPLTYRSVGLDGVMPNPEGPDDIAYYDFSAWPGKGGSGGNGRVLLAGHVDSGREACKNGTVPPPCQAVLWDLNTLTVGTEIQVVFSDVTYKYQVTANEPVDAATGPWEQIVSSTATPSLAIITCGGDFNRETGEYDKRQVVTATFVSQEPV
jgi:hypothetical protein